LIKYKKFFGHHPEDRDIWPCVFDHIEQGDDESWAAYTNRWHTEYATKYIDSSYDGLRGVYEWDTCGHEWANGEFDVECDACVNTSECIEHEVEGEDEIVSPFGRYIQCG